MNDLQEQVSDFLFTPASKDASPWSCNATIFGLALLYTLAFHVTYLTHWMEPTGEDKFVEHPRAEWHNSLGSFVSAVLVVVLVLPGLPEIRTYTDMDCYFGYALWQDLAARAFAAFLLHDFFNLLMYYPLNERPTQLMLFHHILFGALVSYALSGSYFRFMCFWLLAGEASNVFLNIKILMAAAGYKGQWYLINGAVFTVVFGSARVALYGYGLWHILQTRHIWASEAAPRFFKPIIGLMFMGWGLQLYWFYYTLNMLRRALKRQKKKAQ